MQHTKVITAGAFASLLAAAYSPADAQEERSYRDRPPEDEVIYFVLPDRFENADPSNDRGGIEGERLNHGYDPTHKGFFHGGDLKGLTSRLDYIEGLGATAIWLGPIYKNKPVQGPPGNESAGYHGYWITDFTTVDPHFGTELDLKELVDAAHARSIKIYLDIIVNHTADVIQLRECHDPTYKGDDRQPDCPYRSKADYHYTTRGGVNGKKINEGFLGDQPPFQTAENFAHFVRPDFAYTPYIPEGEEDVKRPAWLNDPIYYHNRSDSTWVGESALYGDFSGLDDLMTEHPRVLAGMIDIFKGWITKYEIDGFRVDTARHVGGDFWRPFNAAMLEHAESLGIPNFYIFAEAARDTYRTDPGQIARYTRVDKFPGTLDFGFQAALQDVLVNGAPSLRLEDFFAIDDLYEGGSKTARRLPVFAGNHDMGRFAMFLRQAHPDLSDEEMFSRIRLAHAMMFYLRGTPVIYYGDDQGFNGDGNDQASREDMFPSLTASYNDNDLVGTDKSTADDNFDTDHPLYKAISTMAKIYKAHEPLRRGRQIVRLAEPDGGLFAVSRMGADGGEFLVVINASAEPRNAFINADPRSTRWKSIDGRCRKKAVATGVASVSVPAWDYVVCQSNEWSNAE